MSYLSGYTGRPPGSPEEYEYDFDEDYEAAKDIKEMCDFIDEEHDRINNNEEEDVMTTFSEKFSTGLWYCTMWNCTYGHLVRNKDENEEQQHGNNKKESNNKATKRSVKQSEEANNLNRSNIIRRNKENNNMKGTTTIVEQQHQVAQEMITKKKQDYEVTTWLKRRLKFTHEYAISDRKEAEQMHAQLNEWKMIAKQLRNRYDDVTTNDGVNKVVVNGTAEAPTDEVNDNKLEAIQEEEEEEEEEKDTNKELMNNRRDKRQREHDRLTLLLVSKTRKCRSTRRNARSNSKKELIVKRKDNNTTNISDITETNNDNNIHVQADDDGSMVHDIRKRVRNIHKKMKKKIKRQVKVKNDEALRKEQKKDIGYGDTGEKCIYSNEYIWITSVGKILFRRTLGAHYGTNRFRKYIEPGVV